MLCFTFSVCDWLILRRSEFTGTVSHTNRRGSFSSQNWEIGQRAANSPSHRVLKFKYNFSQWKIAYFYALASSLFLWVHAICRLTVPLTVVGQCETALWPPCEKVEVRERVQLDVIEIHFVIWPPVHLRCTKHNTDNGKTRTYKLKDISIYLYSVIQAPFGCWFVILSVMCLSQWLRHAGLSVKLSVNTYWRYTDVASRGLFLTCAK